MLREQMYENEKWVITATRVDGTLIELTCNTEQEATATYKKIAADKEFSSFKVVSPVLKTQGL